MFVGKILVLPQPHFLATALSDGVIVEGSRMNGMSSTLRTISRSRSYKACWLFTPTMFSTVFLPTIIMLLDLHNNAEREWGEGTRFIPLWWAKWFATSSFVDAPCSHKAYRIARRIRLFVALIICVIFASNLSVPNIHRSYHISAFMSCGIGSPSSFLV